MTIYRDVWSCLKSRQTRGSSRSILSTLTGNSFLGPFTSAIWEPSRWRCQGLDLEPSERKKSHAILLSYGRFPKLFSSSGELQLGRYPRGGGGGERKNRLLTTLSHKNQKPTKQNGFSNIRKIKVEDKPLAGTACTGKSQSVQVHQTTCLSSASCQRHLNANPAPPAHLQVPLQLTAEHGISNNARGWQITEWLSGSHGAPGALQRLPLVCSQRKLPVRASEKEIIINSATPDPCNC